MSKKNGKRHNPLKLQQQRQRLANPSNQALSLMARATVGRLDANTAVSDVQKGHLRNMQISMFSALDVMARQWDVFAFRVLTHYYRVADTLSDLTQNRVLGVAAKESLNVLREIINCEDDRPHFNPVQYRTMARMVAMLSNTIALTPAKLLDIAVQNSLATFTQRVSEQYYGTDVEIRRIAISVLAGETIRSHAQRLDVSEKKLAAKVLEVGQILHGLAMNSTLRFPMNITDLRKISRPLLPIVVRLEKDAHQVAASAAKAAA